MTGASAGIGRAVARAFGARGARVGLIASGESGLDAVADEIASVGGEGLALPLDVADPDAAATLAANAIAPGLLDRYLARTGFDSQQTDRAQDPRAPANLWHPADGPDGHDFGAHGVFEDRSSTRSMQLWASQHHGLLAGAAAGVLASAAPAIGSLLRRQR